MFKRRWSPLAAAAIGLACGELIAATLGTGDIGDVGLAATLAFGAGGLALALVRLIRPRSDQRGIFGGAIALIASAAVVATGALLSHDAGGPRLAWLLALPVAVALVLDSLVAYLRAGDAPGGAAPVIEPGDVPASVKADTVEVLLEAMHRLLDAEDSRAQSLNARATGLGGFAAVLVALLLPAARDLGDGRGPDPLPASVVLMACAALLLVSSVLSVLLGVAVTRTVSTISIDEVKLWESQDFVEKSPTWVRGRLLLTLRKALVTERDANNRKAAWLTAGVTLVAGGVLCATVGGLTLLL